MEWLQIGTFNIVPRAAGFGLTDTDRFNDWRDAFGHTFATRDGAAKWAALCHDFKTGQRSTLPDPAECGDMLT